MKYAVIKTGGKQYIIEEGEEIKIEKIEGDAGDKAEFDEVLLAVDDDKVEIGKPFIKNAKVNAEILEQTKGKKIRGIKYKPGGHRTRYGHRQKLTKVRIERTRV